MARSIVSARVIKSSSFHREDTIFLCFTVNAKTRTLKRTGHDLRTCHTDMTHDKIQILTLFLLFTLPKPFVPRSVRSLMSRRKSWRHWLYVGDS